MAASVPAFPGQFLPWLSTLSQNLSMQWRSQPWKPVGALATVTLGVAWSVSKAPVLAEGKVSWNAGMRDALMEAFQPLASNQMVPFASLSVPAIGDWIEPKTGVVFAGESAEGNALLGVGLRKKCVLGLKNITVYAYGVYADPDSVKSSLGSKYAIFTPAELSGREELFDDVTKSDVGLTVRLVVVYGKLTVGAIRSAFEESVGKGLKKFSADDNTELLGKFRNIFTDDLKLPKGTTIDLSRLPGHVLQAKINGQDIGNIQSPLICRALFDLYIGENAFDKTAKKAIGQGFASFLSS